MSNARQQVLQLVTTAAHNSYTRQLEFLVEAKRLSSDIRDDIVSLFLEISRLEHLQPFPEVTDVRISEISSSSAIISDAASQDDLDALIKKLQDEVSAIAPSNLPLEPLMTDDLLNKRMIDLMGILKQKVREAARRHNDDGGHYDQDAFVSVRNQIYLSRRVYLEQLDHDLVQATNEDCATLEQVIYPDIINSTADGFIGSLKALLDFLKSRVLGTQA